MSYANNNSLNSPQFMLKISIMTFLGLQAIRQLTQVNILASTEGGLETFPGQVSSWLTITLTMLSAVLLYMNGPLTKKPVVGGLLALASALMASGIFMLYDTIDTKTKDKASKIEKHRRMFGIAYTLLGMIILAMLLYIMIG
jgi:hypothetical protein